LADRRLCHTLTAEHGTDGRFGWQSAPRIPARSASRKSSWYSLVFMNISVLPAIQKTFLIFSLQNPAEASFDLNII
jgi:hypothetical protein